MYALFLDIDGVLASARVHETVINPSLMWDKFDPIAIAFLDKLFMKHPLELVISSTWKNYLDKSDPHVQQWIFSSFRNAGFNGDFALPDWKVNPNNDSINRGMYDRALDIKDYLASHPYDDFIVIDDTDYGFNTVLGIKRFVKTDSMDGMLHKHMLTIKSLTGTWKVKNGK